MGPACAAVALSAIALAFAAASGAADRFAVYGIRVLDRITDVLAADLDGDGRDDIVVLHNKGFPPEGERWVSFFWQRPDGGYSTAADLAWELPDSVVAVDTGDVYGDPGVELLLLTPRGVSRAVCSRRARTVSVAPVISGVAGALLPSKERAPAIDFAQDWNGDGRDDVAVMSSGAVLLFNSLPDYVFADPETVQVESRVGISVSTGDDSREFPAVSLTSRLPFLEPIDLDGDGDTDLVVHWADHLRFHLRNDGALSALPDQSLWLRLLDDDEKSRRDFELGVSVIDVDGDGIADLYGGKSTRQGVSDFFSSLVLYFGDGSLDFKREPDWTADVQGMSQGHWIDLDGNGRRELVLPVVSLGIADIIRILISKNVKVQFYFYFVSGAGKMSQEPDFIKDVTLEVGLEEGGEAQIVNFQGDYNGDGRKDMVVATGKDELSVFLGKEPSKGELFEHRPEERIPVETFGHFDAVDLNGDGRDDMILYYKDHPTMSSRAAILVNVGTW
jgi:hypothetical protein